MDNKPLEEQAESLIKQQLLKYNFNVLKPSYDQYGADLLIIDNIKKQYSKTLKIQSKGRSLRGKNNLIVIPSKYVVDDFILFLYTIDNAYDDYLFIFFEEEIKKWNLNSKREYTLSLTSNNVKNKTFQKKVFNQKYAEEIQKRLSQLEVKKYTSVVIDAIFLEQAITKALGFYKEIYPNKIFLKPSIIEVIRNIIVMYNKYTTETKIINCNIFSYMNEALISEIKLNNIILLDNNQECRVYSHDTEEFVWSEVMEYLERVINTENVILVADDPIYQFELTPLKEKGVDISLVKFSGNNDSRFYIEGYKWGDIIYPIAQAMGLNDYEW